jgi:hypothetical protein
MVTNSAELPTETCLGSQQGKQAAAGPTETYLCSQQNKQTAELPTETCLGSQQNKEAAIWLLKHVKAHSTIEWQMTHFSFNNAYF